MDEKKDINNPAEDYTPRQDYEERIAEKKSAILHRPMDRPLAPKRTPSNERRQNSTCENIFFKRRYSLKKLEEMNISEKTIRDYVSRIVGKYPGLKIQHLSTFLMCSRANKHFLKLLDDIGFKSNKGLSVLSKESWNRLIHDFDIEIMEPEDSENEISLTTKTVKEIEELADKKIISIEKAIEMMDKIQDNTKSEMISEVSEDSNFEISNITVNCDIRDILRFIQQMNLKGKFKVTFEKI